MRPTRILALLTRVATALLVPLSSTAAGAATLHIPSEHAQIQSALDVAASGDTLMIDGAASPYQEALSIDTARFAELTLCAAPGASAPIITGDQSYDPILTIDATSGHAARVLLSGLSIDSRDHRRYGIVTHSADSSDDEVVLDLELDGVAVQRCKIGIQVGTRTGTFSCDNRWGAVSAKLLEQARSRITLESCAIVDNDVDGANLYRVDGGIFDTLIGFNGDEGVHSTEARDFVVRHSIIVKNENVGIHFQLGDNIQFENNIVLANADAGYGLSISGMRGSTGAFVYNNVFAWQDASGLKISPCILRVSDVLCEALPVVIDVRNNVFTSNGVGHRGDHSRADINYRDAGVDGMQMIARYNLFEDSDQPCTVPLNDTNLVGVDAAMVHPCPGDRLPSEAGDAFQAYLAAWDRVSGYALDPASLAIDAGEPIPRDARQILRRVDGLAHAAQLVHET